MRTNDDPRSNMILQSVITCPLCGFAKNETMVAGIRRFFYECPRCRTLLRPKAGGCCAFCAFGSIPCPTTQMERAKNDK
jgi:hypothetical protein